MIEPPFWHRLLIGRAPFGFAFEVMLRTVVVYACLLVTVRLLGKRMSGQVTNLELAVMLLLGAIVSAAMQAPDRGVVPGVVLLVGVVLLQYGFSKLGARIPSVGRLLEGGATMLVKDGVVSPDELARARISQQQLFSVLRAHHVRSLGEVERVYLESDGAFSVLRRERAEPGLSVVPDLPGSSDGESRACTYCGRQRARDRAEEAACDVCGHHEWAPAVEP